MVVVVGEGLADGGMIVDTVGVTVDVDTVGVDQDGSSVDQVVPVLQREALRNLLLRWAKHQHTVLGCHCTIYTARVPAAVLPWPPGSFGRTGVQRD